MATQQDEASRKQQCPDYEQLWRTHLGDLEKQVNAGLLQAGQLVGQGRFTQASDVLSQVRTLCAELAHMDECERYARPVAAP